jgi:hypothetical protein
MGRIEQQAFAGLPEQCVGHLPNRLFPIPTVRKKYGILLMDQKRCRRTSKSRQVEDVREMCYQDGIEPLFSQLFLNTEDSVFGVHGLARVKKIGNDSLIPLGISIVGKKETVTSFGMAKDKRAPFPPK